MSDNQFKEKKTMSLLLEWSKLNRLDPMKWIKINSPSELPKDQFILAIWKNSFYHCEYDEEEDAFFLGIFPNQTIGCMRVSKDREKKFTHYCLLEFPDDY